MTDSCPDENVLVDYARGSLSQLGRERVDAHVDGCERCRVALSGLARRVSVSDSVEVVTQPESLHPMPGTFLADRFRVLDPLGVGAMGTVYEAEDITLGERVAVKVLAPHIAERRDVLEFLRREISLGRRVSHPNVCPVYDLGISGSYHFISMKLVVGKTLDQALEDGLTSARIEKILSQLASSLAAAHARGVVHRDLKAANVMIDEADHVWVMDFGLARDIERDPSFSGPVGTPAYWSPEQALGDPATPASDVYSFGVVAYRLWTGKLPRRHREKTSFKDIAPPWRPLIERCLAERVSERPPNGEALVQEIARLRERPRRRALLFGGVGLVVAASAITFGVVKLGAPEPAPVISQPERPPPAPAPPPEPAPAPKSEPIAPPVVEAAKEPASIVDAGQPQLVQSAPPSPKPKPKPKPRKPEDVPIFE